MKEIVAVFFFTQLVQKHGKVENMVEICWEIDSNTSGEIYKPLESKKTRPIDCIHGVCVCVCYTALI